MKLKIKEGLQKRFKVSDQGQPMYEVLGSPLLIASLLDPKYKTLVGRDIVPEGKVDILYLVVTDSMGELNDPTETQEDKNSEGAVPPKKSKLWVGRLIPIIISRANKMSHWITLGNL